MELHGNCGAWDLMTPCKNLLLLRNTLSWEPWDRWCLTRTEINSICTCMKYINCHSFNLVFPLHIVQYTILSQGCHNRASRPDSEHIITEQYPNCVNYMVTMPYIPYIVSGVWVHITLVPRGCMLSVYKALYPYVTREVLMNIIMNLPYVGRPHYQCEPWHIPTSTCILNSIS